MGRNWIWIFILIAFTSCLEDVKPGQHQVFHIPKNDHYSARIIKKYNQNILTFAYRFDETAIYNLNGIDHFDTNKLLGFKYGLNPRKNSFRIGWRWSLEDEYVIIAAYSYIDGIRSIKDIGYCFINEIYSAEIEETHEEVIYRFKDLTHRVSKSGNESGKKYYSFPYFGGNQKAPHDINIEIWFQ